MLGQQRKLKKGGKFKCQTSAYQQTDMEQMNPGIELNSQSIEIVETFCYLGDTTEVKGSKVDIFHSKNKLME